MPLPSDSISTDPPSSGIDAPQILLIEDNPGDAVLIRANLRRSETPFELTWVDGLGKGLEALLERRFDAILLDLSLTESDGLQTVSRVLAAVHSAPVVVVTGSDDDGLASAAMRLGAQDYLPKSDLNARALSRVISYAIERAAAQAALAEAESRNRHLIWTAGYGIFRTDSTGVFIDVNPACAEMLGFSDPGELVGKRATFLGPSTDGERRPLALHAEERIEKLEVQIPVASGDTALFRLDANKGVNRRTGAVEWEGFLQDITEARRLEAQTRQNEKMEALGLFSAGVAHDLNNLLTVVLGSIDELESEVGEVAPIREELEVIHSAVSRGAHLVRKILAYSRRERLALNRLDLGSLARSQSPLLSRLHPGVAVRIEVPETPVRVMGDSSAMEQVILNLVTNGVRATESVGEVVVSVHETEIVSPVTGRNESVAELRVQDFGTGIPEEIQSRIFEPFFSTRERGSGTGLGLSMVMGLVPQQNGRIEFETAEGIGPTFSVFLPLVDQEEKAPLDLGERAFQNRTTVLLVEDEADIRRAGGRGLARAGYTVIQAADGREGLAKFIEHRDEIGLVITDVIMPKMNGAEMLEEILQLEPAMNYLYTSGYSGTDLATRQILDPDQRLLPKPWGIDELLSEAAQLLPPPGRKAAG